MWYIAACPFEEPSLTFCAIVIGMVAGYNVTTDFIFIRHRGGRIRHPIEFCTEARRRVGPEPLEMDFTGMTTCRIETKCMFVYETESHATEPHIMGQGSRCPQDTWMFGCMIFIPTFSSGCTNRCRCFYTACPTIGVMRRI